MDDRNFRAANERRMAENLARNLPAEQLELWNSFKYAGRFFFTKNDYFAVIEAKGKVQNTLDVWRPTFVKADFYSGLELLVTNLEAHTARITHAPSLLPNSKVFVWIPPFAMDMRMVEDGHSRTQHLLSLNLAFKCQHAPNFEVDAPKVYLTKTR